MMKFGIMLIKKFIILLCSLLALGLVSCAVVVPDTEDTDTGEAITSLEPKTPKSHDPIVETPSDEKTTLLTGVWLDYYGYAYVINCDYMKSDSSIVHNMTSFGTYDYYDTDNKIIYRDWDNYAYIERDDAYASYAGANTTICFDTNRNTAGYIYFEYTRAYCDDIGKWGAIRFKYLSESSVEFSKAYGAKSSTDTLEEAMDEFTVDNGYFTVYSICKKLN